VRQLLLSAFILISFALQAQDSTKAIRQMYKKLIILDSAKTVNSSKLFNYSDSLKFNQRFKSVKDSLTAIGYLRPEIDISTKDLVISYKIYPGNRYKWLNLTIGKDDNKIIDRLRVDLSKWNNTYVSTTRLHNISEQILNYLDNSGYPFASVYLDSILFESGDSLSAKLDIVLNKKVYFDTIKVRTKVDLSYKYLENYLGIRKGDVFDKNKIKQIKQKIDNLPFLTLDKQPGVGFFGNEASIILLLKSKKVNRFNFIIGLLPDKSGLKKYKLTGELMTEMVNRLGHGERLYFKYKNLSQGKQSLHLETNYPYILDLPYGIDSKFNIYINEKSYRDVNFNLGVQYLFHGINYLKTYWSLFSSRLIAIDSSLIVNSGRLPNKLDVSTNSFGFQLNYNTLDYKFSPSRGYKLDFDANIGQRKIIRNQQILALPGDGIDFSNSYDTLKTPTYQYKISAGLSYYISLSRNIVMKINNKFAIKKSEVKLFQNELFRLGGNKILRGFDEESINGDIFNLSTAELRLIIDRNSFLFAFMDYAFVRDPFATINKWDRPYGFGVGINFDTKGGIIRLTTALGSRLGNPIDYKDVKIHLGYISLF